MRRVVGALLLCLFWGSAAWGLDVVRDGKPVARIVVPDEADSYTTRAAGWIRDYVKKATGAELAVVPEGQDTGQGPRIALGATKAARQARVRADDLAWDGCRLVVKGDTLFLVGRDEDGVGKADYKAPKGTCRAATAFLEEFCGVRWLAPTPLGEVVPQRRDISVPDDLNRVIVPAFGYANGRLIHGVRTPASYANNFREALRLYTAGGHTWPVFVPLERYYEEHPEYFALINGQRSNSRMNHLCTTNPDVKRLLLEGLRGKFDEGYDWAQLAQSDGYRRCECPNCEAMDNYREWGRGDAFLFKTLAENPCERVLKLHRDIAEQCRRSHPNKKVHILSYGPTTMPSRAFDKFPDNVVVELCNTDPRVLAAWRGKAKAFTAYVYYYGTYNAPGPGPKFTAAQAAEELRRLRDHQIQGIYFCGIGECWGLEGHSYYACAKLLGNPDLDPQALVAEYCNGLYGKAAPAMLRFYEALDSVVSLYYPMKRLSGGRLASLNTAEAAYIAMYPPAVLSRLESLLRSAEQLADDERSRKWIGLTRISFDYVRLTATAYTLYRAYQTNPNRAVLLQLQDAVEKWRAHRDRILNLDKKSVAEWFPGHASWVDFFKTKGHLNSVIRAPFDWDFEKMLARYAAGTPQGPPLLRVARAPKPPVLDGIIHEEEWKHATPVEVGLVSGGPAPVETSVRAAYDDRCLYVAFTCAEPQIQAMRRTGQKRDGALWNLDCVELFLDPESMGTKFLHFIAVPDDDARYDARRGYIEDPVHPLYDREDVSWNAEWRHAYVVDAANGKWCVEMELPFASLGIAPPPPGTRWKGNFGRERYAGLKGGNDPELYLWSPNELGTGFCEPLCFGEIRFEAAGAR